jgi:hypothetical protein
MGLREGEYWKCINDYTTSPYICGMFYNISKMFIPKTIYDNDTDVHCVLNHTRGLRLFLSYHPISTKFKIITLEDNNIFTNLGCKQLDLIWDTLYRHDYEENNQFRVCIIESGLAYAIEHNQINAVTYIVDREGIRTTNHDEYINLVIYYGNIKILRYLLSKWSGPFLINIFDIVDVIKNGYYNIIKLLTERFPLLLNDSSFYNRAIKNKQTRIATLLKDLYKHEIDPK